MFAATSLPAWASPALTSSRQLSQVPCFRYQPRKASRLARALLAHACGARSTMTRMLLLFFPTQKRGRHKRTSHLTNMMTLPSATLAPRNASECPPLRLVPAWCHQVPSWSQPPTGLVAHMVASPLALTLSFVSPSSQCPPLGGHRQPATTAAPPAPWRHAGATMPVSCRVHHRW